MNGIIWGSPILIAGIEDWDFSLWARCKDFLSWESGIFENLFISKTWDIENQGIFILRDWDFPRNFAGMGIFLDMEYPIKKPPLVMSETQIKNEYHQK